MTSTSVDKDNKDFTRISWPSGENVWEGRIPIIADVWREVEIHSILEGVRDSALVFVNPRELSAKSYKWMEKGLCWCIVDTVAQVQNYTNFHKAPGPNEPFDYRIAIAKNADNLNRLVKAYLERADGSGAKKNDDIGHLLGYPKCCREAFCESWMRGFRDPVAGQLLGIGAYSADLHQYYFEANIMLRYLGLRLVPWLPCSVGCVQTRDLAFRFAQCFERLDKKEELKWLVELLKMPMKWTSLHGIAEIVTPFCKITTSSDHFNKVRELKLNPIVHNDFAHLNGFKSEEDMHNGHKFILGLTSQIQYNSVLDLGCGDGTLLRALEHSKGITLLGVDQIPTEENGFNFYNESIDSFLNRPSLGQFDLILIADQRFTETEFPGKLFQQLKDHCKYLLIYDYNGLPTINYIGQIYGNEKAALIKVK